MRVLLENLTKRFGGLGKNVDEVIAVNNFNLEIPDGKLVGLLGPSGCGKSTALNLISGLLTPSEGKVFFGDDDVTDVPPEKRGVGLVFQNYALYPHLSVRKNILFPLENLKGKEKLTKSQMNERLMSAAKLVQIDGLLDRKPAELSGGQQQRVAIARSLVKLPRVLLLDEPLSNLDARLRLQTREELRRIQRETGITTIFVTHDQEEAMSICDVIVVMKSGVIQQVGRPQEVYDEPANLFVAKFLGTPPINVFKGKILSQKLYIGNDCVFDVPDMNDRDVFVGVRPEGFIPSEDGNLICALERVEVLGRDVNIISKHDAVRGENIRSIVESDNAILHNEKTVRFNIKPNKIVLFDAQTEERIPLSF